MIYALIYLGAGCGLYLMSLGGGSPRTDEGAIHKVMLLGFVSLFWPWLLVVAAVDVVRDLRKENPL